MTGVFCLAGRTQIGKVLQRAAKETRQRKVSALVFVGDAMEEELDHLGHLAGELGLLGVPCYMFHEGSDAVARRAFQQLARDRKSVVEGKSVAVRLNIGGLRILQK